MFEADQAPESESTEQKTPEGAEPSEAAEQAPSILDLESVEKFKFAGREWTPKDFQGAYMMQSDYTRKTQALSEERKYYDNLQADLDAVKANPQLAAQFKSVYPEKYHKFLGYVSQPAPASQPDKNQSPGMDPAFVERFNRLETELHERKVEAASASIEATFQVMSKKFPMADEEAVIARAQSLLNQGTKLDDKAWEGLFKSVHERNQKLAEKFYSERVQKQKQANSQGRDVASGGGTPGQAPKLPKTIKEASDFALRDLENS